MREKQLFLQPTTRIAATGYSAHKDWSIAIDMQIARIISTLDVYTVKGKRHREGVTITGRRIQRVPRRCSATTTTMTRRRRSHNRRSSVIKMKNYALLRLSPSTVSVWIETVASALRSAAGSDQLDSFVRKCRGKSRTKWNSFNTTRRYINSS